MATVYEKFSKATPPNDFDWELYDDGWNGSGLKQNKSIKTDNNVKVFCHEKYAQKAYNKYANPKGATFDYEPKDLTEGNVIKIKDIQLLADDELLLSTNNGGAAIVNLAKENKFFEMFDMSKDEFKETWLKSPEGKKVFLDNKYLAKIEKNGKASLYQGTIVKTEREFMNQIALGSKANMAYKGKIIGSNRGGFIMDVQGIKCFLPGGQATSNKVIDFDSLVGTEMEVMIMKYIEGSGFLVSRKMYLQKLQPQMINLLREEFEKDPERIYSGKVTGAKHFGIFIELNENYTGLLHKMYTAPETLEKITAPLNAADLDMNAKLNYPPETEIAVKIYKITDDDKIIFTDIMDKAERDSIVADRERLEAEAAAAAKAEAEAEKARIIAEREKKARQKADNAFKGAVVSLEDLKL